MQDEDGSGEVTGDELYSVLQKLGIKLDRQETNEILAMVDPDNSGSVDRDEFHTILKSLFRTRRRKASITDADINLQSFQRQVRIVHVFIAQPSVLSCAMVGRNN